uniref:VOC family protein n=1 Tax=Fodinicola feengrottensis TaxID=435914 RepID=UPI0024416501|nr:VOC family protein [Fodinicola feengrottensis]
MSISAANPAPRATERLVALGATYKTEYRQPGLRWSVLVDPEGNEFCIGEHSG